MLVLQRENQLKQNRIPLEYFADNPARCEAFITWVEAMIKDKKKRDLLTKEQFTEEDEKEWKARDFDRQQLHRALLQAIHCR